MDTETSRTYKVEGMSCGHCEAAVRGELAKVGGVEAVAVDLGSGHVAVGGEFEDSAVRAAIAAAGYQAAG